MSVSRPPQRQQRLPSRSRRSSASSRPKARIRLSDLYRDIPVIQVLAARDFKVKYKQSLLGPLWLVFQPLALLVAFLVAFRGLADVQPGVPYTVFALVGLSAWTFFQAAMTIGAASLVSNVMLVRFTPCPRLAFPIAGILASLPSWAVTTAAALIAAAVTGTLSPKALLLPLGLVWLFLLTWGLVAIAAALTARFRDMLSALPFLLQVGVFLAPVGYPLYELNSTVRVLIDLNPLTGLIEASALDGDLGIHAVVRADRRSGSSPLRSSRSAGWRVFARREPTLADYI